MLTISHHKYRETCASLQLIKQPVKAIPFSILLIFAGSLSSLAQPNTWVQKSDLGYDTFNVSEPTPRSGAVGFSIGSKGYIGTGWSLESGQNIYKKDFWEYDPAINTWTQKKDFGGTARYDAIGFSIGIKGYIGTGYDEFNKFRKDFWEYDPVVNIWRQKAAFGGTGRYGATGFGTASEGYIGTGYDGFNSYRKDFWEYDPVANTWIEKADFGGNRTKWRCRF